MTKIYVVKTWKSDTNGLERTKAITGILGADMVEFANETLLEVAIQANVGDLLPLIGERIGSKNIGYLLRVNLYIDPTSGKARPTTNLISPIGPGVEPLDALAESERTKSFTADFPKLSITRRYLWCTRAGDDLKISCPNAVLGAHIETQARIEARRRHILGAFFATESATGFLRAQRAEFWRNLTDTRLRQLDDEAARMRISALNTAFAAAQDRFNEAYTQFQLAERELAVAAQEAAMLQAIGAVMGLLRTGLEAQAKLSLEQSEGPEAAMRWRKHQMEVIGGIKTASAAQLDSFLTSLKALDAQLAEEWSKARAEVPRTDWEALRTWNIQPH